MYCYLGIISWGKPNATNHPQVWGLWHWIYPYLGWCTTSPKWLVNGMVHYWVYHIAEDECIHKHPVAPFSVRAFCTISSSSGPLKVYFVCISCGKNKVFLCSMHKMMWKLACVFEKIIFRLCFHPILTENYVKFNIVWNRLCPHNMCHRIKIGKRKRGLRGIFIIIFVQNLSKSVRI